MAKKKARKAAKQPTKRPARKVAKKQAKRVARKPAKKPAKKAAKKVKPAAEPQMAGKSKHGEFMWNELMTRDDTRALEFFEQLLGWSHNDWPLGPDAGGSVYRLMMAAGKSVAGIMKMTEPQFPPQVPPHWMSYIAVDDVDARWQQALVLGAEPIHPPTDIPQVGRFCIFKDPTGAPISLMTPAGGTA